MGFFLGTKMSELQIILQVVEIVVLVPVDPIPLKHFVWCIYMS